MVALLVSGRCATAKRGGVARTSAPIGAHEPNGLANQHQPNPIMAGGGGRRLSWLVGPAQRRCGRSTQPDHTPTGTGPGRPPNWPRPRRPAVPGWVSWVAATQLAQNRADQPGPDRRRTSMTARCDHAPDAGDTVHRRAGNGCNEPHPPDRNAVRPPPARSGRCGCRTSIAHPPPASARARASRAPGDWAGAATATANLRRHCSPRPTGHTPAPDRYRSPVPVTAGRTGAVSDPVPLTGVAPVDRYTADAARAGRTGAGAPVPVTTGTAVQRHAPPGTGTAVTGTARPHTRNPDGRTGPPDDPHHLPRPRSRHEP